MESNYKAEHKAVLDELLTSIPGVTTSKAFGYPAYKIGRRIFAFVTGDGLALKLPADRVAALVEAHEEMQGTMWREWVSIRLSDPSDYAHYVDLFEESLQFVGG
jgi:hypothetical protein